VGREREMVEVKRELAMTRLLTITGAGGSGKTRLAVLLNVHLASPFRPLPRRSVLTRARVRATDPALWRGLLYLILLLPIGLVELVVILVPILAAFLVSYPLWFWTLPEGTGVTWTGIFVADTVPEALLVMLIGLAFASAAAAFVPQVSQAHAWLGRILLAPVAGMVLRSGWRS
jgi:hypothetical protein